MQDFKSNTALELQLRELDIVKKEQQCKEWEEQLKLKTREANQQLCKMLGKP